MNNRPWAEILQLVPTIALALPFLIAGEVDRLRAESGFAIAAVLALAVALLVRKAGQLQNPIAVGAAVWLGGGAIGFQLDVSTITDWYLRTQALGLILACAGAGLAFTLLSPTGFLACRTEPSWITRSSWMLCALSVVCVMGAWWFRANIRLGGGVPFLILNVARRILCLRAPQPSAHSV